MKQKFDLNQLSGGAFSEKINKSIGRVLDNIADPNTDFKPKRKVTIDLTFQANEDRDFTEVLISTKEKLAPEKTAETRFIIDRNSDGQVIGGEFKKQVPGQRVMAVDAITGEILNPDIEKSGNLEGLKIVK